MKSPTYPLTLSLIIASVFYLLPFSPPSIQSVSHAIQINYRSKQSTEF